MKRITAVVLFAFAGILTAGNALAQQHNVRVTVPFDFTVGDKLLPSGTYTINSVSDTGIEIQSREQHVAMLASAFATSQQSKNGDELVFEKRGSRYSLREILCGSAAMNVSLPAEKWNKSSRTEEAKLHNTGEQVLIAAK